MVKVEADITHLGGIDFCTLGMFILGMHMYFETPQVPSSR